MSELQAKPICDLCGKPVDFFDEEFCDFMGRVRFTARCHGEKETVDISGPELKAWRDSNIGFARAFIRLKHLPPRWP